MKPELRTIAFPFYEDSNGYKLLYAIHPELKIHIHKVAYSLGALDTSANGYIKIIISKNEVLPNLNGVYSDNQIICEFMTSAQHYLDNTITFEKNAYIINASEPFYIHMINNLPNIGVFGNITIYYTIEE